MNEPKVTFKNVKFFRGMEGYGVNADVYINGVKCYFVMDAGDGGMMDFEHNIHGNVRNIEKIKENMKLLNDYIETLPEKEFKFGDKTKFYKVSLEDFINDKLIELEKEKNKKKFENKMKKLFNTCIVFGVPNSGTYQYLNYKRPLVNFPEMYLQNQIDNVRKKYCKDGVEILNTNLEGLII